jgi:hypothetical protein
MADFFLKFIGPMVTLSQGKNKFEKGKIYLVQDEDRAMDMIETGRFQQTRDPRSKKTEEEPVRRGGVRIQRSEPKFEKPPETAGFERGDISTADLQNGGAQADAVHEAPNPEDDHPRLPAEPFTSKRECIEWAKTNLDLELDKSRSVTELNRKIVEAYGIKFKQPDAEELDDDTRDENTKVDAIIVA